MIEKALQYKIESLSNGVMAFPLAAPEGKNTPYIVYSRIGTDRIPTLTEQGAHKPSYQITIAEKSYSKMVTLRKTIREGLEFQTGVFKPGTPEVQNLIIQNEDEMYDPETKEYIGILDILIIYN